MSRRVAEYLCPPGFSGPTGLAIAREASVVLEISRLVGGAARERARIKRSRATPVPPGTVDADPVVLVPGFLAGDYTLRAFSRHLRGRGHRTYSARILANARCLAETADALEQRVETIVDRRGRPAVIVGHSLGGLLARGMAARRPDLVSGIITMGSPLLAPAAVHRLLLLDVQMLMTLQRLGVARVMGADCTSGECARAMWDEARRPLPDGLHFTSIYSRRDGIMDWKACLDPAAQHVEVTTSHTGMAIDPRVFGAVTDALAEVGATAMRRQLRLAGAAG